MLAMPRYEFASAGALSCAGHYGGTATFRLQQQGNTMSFNHENVIWQSENGTWNIGFYERIAGSSHFDQDYDPEWDDEFDHNNFQFASCGHPTEEATYDAWQGSNPGSYDVVP